MACPEALDEKPIEHRRDILVKLEISVSSETSVVYTPGYCIKVPKTKSIKRFGSHDERSVLDLTLEVRGATTGRVLKSACHACSIRESSSSSNLPIVDFVAQEDLIKVKGSKAFVAFRFLCLPGHHGTMDEEYQCANFAISNCIAYVPAE